MMETIQTTPPTSMEGTRYSPHTQREIFSPWVFVGSIILFVFGVFIFAFTFDKSGDARTLWSYLITGIFTMLLGLFGIFASRSSTRKWAIVFFWVFVAVLVVTAILLIANSARFHDYMRRRCEEHGFARETNGCAHIRQYYLITLHAFTMFYFLLAPTFLIIAGYFWYYSKYEFGKA